MNLARSPDGLNETNTSLCLKRPKQIVVVVFFVLEGRRAIALVISGCCVVLLVYGMASHLIMCGAVLYSSLINLYIQQIG